MSLEMSKPFRALILVLSLIVMLTLVSAMFMPIRPDDSQMYLVFRSVAITLFLYILVRGFLVRDYAKRLLEPPPANHQGENPLPSARPPYKSIIKCIIEFIFVIAGYLVAYYVFLLGYFLVVGLFGLIVFYFVQRFFLSKYELLASRQALLEILEEVLAMKEKDESTK